jgi:hypothetical protein
MMFRLFAASLLCLCTLPEAAGARQPGEGEEVICLTIAVPWTPRNSDTSRIGSEPVPASFRRIMDAGGCGRFQLMKPDLITWHLRFGSERSATAALAYLEQELTSGAPAPRDHVAALQRAWRAALPDLRRAAATPQPPGASTSAAHRVMERSRSIDRLTQLIYARQTYLDIAREYLRAGQEYASLPLLARAEAYLLAAEESARFLAPLNSQAPRLGLLNIDADGFLEQDFRMRISVTKAIATRSPADLAQAQSLVAAAERPFYRLLAERSYSGGGDLCDISEGWSGAEALESACRREDDVGERLTNYWINRAMLDLAQDRADADSVELALRLLDREQSGGGGGRCCLYVASEDVLRLRLTRAGAAARTFVRAANADPDRRSEAWSLALEELRAAEQSSPPHEAPARFRRIAEAWLELWRQGPALVPAGRRAEDLWPQRARYAAYLSSALDRLQEIALGHSASR